MGSASTGGSRSMRRGIGSGTTARSRATWTRRRCWRVEKPRCAAREEVLHRVGGRPGHIFNVGHGILPGTDPETIRAVVEFVHECR